MAAKKAGPTKKTKTPDIRRIAVSTSGGDAPGLNAVIRGVTKSAIQKYHWEVIGIMNGLEGLIDTSRIIPLTIDRVRGIMQRGGTILGADSSGYPFNRQVIRDGEAVDLDVPAPVITLSLQRRFSSRQDESYAAKVLAAMRNQFGGHAVKKAKE